MGCITFSADAYHAPLPHACCPSLLMTCDTCLSWRVEGDIQIPAFSPLHSNQASVLQGGDVSHLNKSSISAVRAQQTSGASSPALKLLQVLLPLLVILAAIFVPKYLL